MGKDLKEFDFVGNVKERGILVEGDTERGPDCPVLAGGSTAAGNDSGVGRFFCCKAEITGGIHLRSLETKNLRLLLWIRVVKIGKKRRVRKVP
jgi:hypothetical protein